MKYRRLSESGDYVFGGGLQSFWVDQPEGVAQAVQTRLALWTGHWFLDRKEGTDWINKVLGNNTRGIYDITVRDRILQTQGVVQITDYASQPDSETRSLSIQATVETVYGPVTVLVPASVYAPAATRAPAVVPPTVIPQPIAAPSSAAPPATTPAAAPPAGPAYADLNNFALGVNELAPGGP